MGIDPGLDGGICIMTDDGNVIYLEKMPTLKFEMATKKRVKGKLVPKIRREVDIKVFAELLAKYEPEIVYIEQVHAMPGQGVTSMFNFGYGYGMLVGLLKALAGVITLVQITPQAWQKSIHREGLEGSAKEKALYMAATLFPQSYKKHDGLVDALLIAEHGRRGLKLN